MVYGKEETGKYGIYSNATGEEDMQKRIPTVVKTRINIKGLKCNEEDSKWYIYRIIEYTDAVKI